MSRLVNKRDVIFWSNKSHPLSFFHWWFVTSLFGLLRKFIFSWKSYPIYDFSRSSSKSFLGTKEAVFKSRIFSRDKGEHDRINFLHFQNPDWEIFLVQISLLILSSKYDLVLDCSIYSRVFENFLEHQVIGFDEFEIKILTISKN